MNLLSIIFYLFILLAASSALGIVFSRDLFKSALFLLLCLLSVAALFVLCYAEFVAVTQILIYAGGILVIILFGIMFTTKVNGKPLVVGHANIFWGVLVGMVLFGLIASRIVESSERFAASQVPNGSSIEGIGNHLITTYALPFEVIGFLLLAALLGASVLTAFLKIKRS